MRVSRRAVITGLLGGTSLIVNPRIHPLTAVRSADAWVIAAIGLLIAAVSAFTKKPNGMGAMLGALRELSLQNIRLTQQVIAQLGDVQRSIDQLPVTLRPTFIEQAGWPIQQAINTSIQKLDQVQLSLANDPANISSKGVQRSLETVITSCDWAAGSTNLPPGIGCAGAVCALLAPGLVASAYTLLGERDAVPAAFQSTYLPWLQSTTNPELPDSVAGLMFKAGAELRAAEAALRDRLPEFVRSQLTAKDLQTIVTLPVGSRMKVPAACMQLRKEIGRNTVCHYWPCGRPPEDLPKSMRDKCACKKSEDRGPKFEYGTYNHHLRMTVTNVDSTDSPPELLAVADEETRMFSRPEQTRECVPIDVSDVEAWNTLSTSPNFVQLRSSIADLSAKPKPGSSDRLDGFGEINERRRILWVYANLALASKEAENRARAAFDL